MDIPKGYILLDHISKVTVIFIRQNTNGKKRSKKKSKGKEDSLVSRQFSVNEMLDISRSNQETASRNITTREPLFLSRSFMVGFVCKNPAKQDITTLTLSVAFSRESTLRITRPVSFTKCGQLKPAKKGFQSKSDFLEREESEIS